jgi:molybdenum cofactor cytidylyltransferase
MPDDQTYPIAGVVLAAGLSQRFGQPKQLVEIHGRILLAHVLEQVLGCDFKSVILVLGHQADEIMAALDSDKGLGPDKISMLQVVRNPKYATGQASSVRVGLNALGSEIEAAMFIMGDQIGLTREHIEPIMDRYAQPDKPWIVRPRYGDRFGGPVLWARPSFKFLETLEGDQGGRFAIKNIPADRVAIVDMPGAMAPVDIDTQADLERWLAEAEPS